MIKTPLPAHFFVRRALIFSGLTQILLDSICLALSLVIWSDTFLSQALIASTAAHIVFSVLTIGAERERVGSCLLVLERT